MLRNRMRIEGFEQHIQFARQITLGNIVLTQYQFNDGRKGFRQRGTATRKITGTTQHRHRIAGETGQINKAFFFVGHAVTVRCENWQHRLT